MCKYMRVGAFATHLELGMKSAMYYVNKKEIEEDNEYGDSNFFNQTINPYFKARIY